MERFAFSSSYSLGDGLKYKAHRVGDMYVFHDEDACEDLMQDVGLVATSASWKVQSEQRFSDVLANWVQRGARQSLVTARQEERGHGTAFLVVSLAEPILNCLLRVCWGTFASFLLKL